MTCQCAYGTCNKCLVSRSLQSGLIFFAVVSPPVQQMLQGDVFKSTLLFMVLAFLLMKLKSKKSYYRLASKLDMTKNPGLRLGAMIGGDGDAEYSPFQ
jgi:hypothetical protein